MTLDGVPVDFTKNKEQYYFIHVSEAGKVKPLRDGRHMILVTCADWMGNEGSTPFTILIDNTLRPRRAINQPGSGTTGGSTGGGGGSGGGGGGRRGGE